MMQINSWNFALRFWWAFVWRALLWGVLLGFVIGFVVGFFGAFAHWEKPFVGKVVLLTILPGAVALNLWIMKTLLGKKYSGYRLQLVKADEQGQDFAPAAPPPVLPPKPQTEQSLPIVQRR